MGNLSLFSHFNLISLIKTASVLTSISLLFALSFYISSPTFVDASKSYKELGLGSLFEFIGVFILFAILIAVSIITVNNKYTSRRAKLSFVICFLITLLISLYSISFFPLNSTFVYLTGVNSQSFYKTASFTKSIIQFVITSSLFSLCFYDSSQKNFVYNYCVNLISCFLVLFIAYELLDCLDIYGKSSFEDTIKIEKNSSKSIISFISTVFLVSISLYYLRSYLFYKQYFAKLFTDSFKSYATAFVIAFTVYVICFLVHWILNKEMRFLFDGSIVIAIFLAVFPYLYLVGIRLNLTARFIITLPIFLPITAFAVVAVLR